MKTAKHNILHSINGRIHESVIWVMLGCLLLGILLPLGFRLRHDAQEVAKTTNAAMLTRAANDALRAGATYGVGPGYDIDITNAESAIACLEHGVRVGTSQYSYQGVKHRSSYTVTVTTGPTKLFLFGSKTGREFEP